MNKRILISLSVIGAVAAIAVGGTIAYFSSTASSTGNTFTAGTLVLQLSDNNQGWADGVNATWVSPNNWAPGETVEGTLRMVNIGSIGVKMIAVKGENLTGTGLANAVLLTKMVISGTNEPGTPEGGGTNIIADVITYGTQAGDGIKLDANGDGKLTLGEFVWWCDKGNSLKFWAGNKTGDDYLSPNPGASESGDWEFITLGFTFDPAAGNAYQGLNASFGLRIVAYQTYGQEAPVYGPGIH